MQKKVFFYSTLLALFFYVWFLSPQDAEAFRGVAERERIPIGSFSDGAAFKPPVSPGPAQPPKQQPRLPVNPDPAQVPTPVQPNPLQPVQPSPAEPGQESGQDNFRYTSPARGSSRSGGVNVTVLPGNPGLPGNNSPSSPKQPANPGSSQPRSPVNPDPEQPPIPAEPEVPSGLTSEEARALALLNEFRAENNLPPLKSHPGLVEIARLKAQDLVENNYFNHVSPTYGSIGQMLKKAGISYSNAAENLSKAGNINQAHLQLVYSTQGHRQIMLSPNLNFVGIGVLPLKNAPGIIMVQLFIKN